MLLAAPQADSLEVRLVANAGVIVSDGSTTLAFDLPYESGAHGYDEYAAESIAATGRVVAVITHEHTDHFDPGLFLATDWSLAGGPPVTRLVPADRVIAGDSAGDSLRVGAFSVIVLPSEHVPGHRSYRVRWHDRVIFVPGDAENYDVLTSQPRLDVAFVTPWLACAVRRPGRSIDAERVVGYHRWGSDDFCGPAELWEPNGSIRLAATASP